MTLQGAPIDRRRFLAGLLGASAVGMVRGPFHVPLLRRSKAIGDAVQPRLGSTSGGGTLVLLTLYGGNDGLDTVVPYTDPAYLQQRGPIAVAPSSVQVLGDGLGFHPALTGMKALWDAGQLAIIRGVGYPDPNYSHFQSMDIWQSGDPSGDLATGWLGRWLDRTGSDPMRALWLGTNLPLAFVGDSQQASSVIPSSSPNAQVPAGGPELRQLYQVLERAHRYDSPLERGITVAGKNMLAVSSEVVQMLSHAPGVAQDFPAAAGTLGTSLGVAAQLILAGSPTKVYGVSLNGFDSHAGEVLAYGTLLKQLDAGVSGFFKALGNGPAAANTILLIYSEFGRRVASNASGGTDHGSGGVAFAAGPSVKGGFYGDQPSLTQLDSNGSLIVTTDYRSIYTTVLDAVLDIDPSSILSNQFQGIPFL